MTTRIDVRRVALSLPPPSLGETFDDAAFVLTGLDTRSQNEALHALLGVPDGRRPSHAELLQFLETHGETWVLARLELLKAHLKTLAQQS